MTKRIGNKDEAQHRGKQEKKDIKRTNKAREMIKQAIAKAKYHNQVSFQQPTSATMWAFLRPAVCRIRRWRRHSPAASRRSPNSAVGAAAAAVSCAGYNYGG
jgi:hypothetical protein